MLDTIIRENRKWHMEQSVKNSDKANEKPTAVMIEEHRMNEQDHDETIPTVA